MYVRAVQCSCRCSLYTHTLTPSIVNMICILEPSSNLLLITQYRSILLKVHLMSEKEKEVCDWKIENHTAEVVDKAAKHLFMTHISNAHFYGVGLCLIRMSFATIDFATSLYACSLYISIHLCNAHSAMSIEFFHCVCVCVALHMHFIRSHTNTSNHMQTCKSRLREGFALLKGKLNFYKRFFRLILCSIQQ